MTIKEIKDKDIKLRPSSWADALQKQGTIGQNLTTAHKLIKDRASKLARRRLGDVVIDAVSKNKSFQFVIDDDTFSFENEEEEEEEDVTYYAESATFELDEAYLMLGFINGFDEELTYWTEYRGLLPHELTDEDVWGFFVTDPIVGLFAKKGFPLITKISVAGETIDLPGPLDLEHYGLEDDDWVGYLSLIYSRLFDRPYLSKVIKDLLPHHYSFYDEEGRKVRLANYEALNSPEWFKEELTLKAYFEKSQKSLPAYEFEVSGDSIVEADDELNIGGLTNWVNFEELEDATYEVKFEQLRFNADIFGIEAVQL